MSGVWKVYRDPPLDGATQMALDALALERATAGEHVLRLYRWRLPTLSIGRAQKLERELALEACRAEGIPVIRRITGGRTVLHGDDITYSVAAPNIQGPFSGGVLAVYRELSAVFVQWLRTLGLEPHIQAYEGRERGQQASAICFATPSAYEILLQGRKMVGSAQRWQPGAFLQHGSIPLRPQHGQLQRLFTHGGREQIEQQMTDLTSAGVLPRFSEAQVEEALLESFATVLGVELRPAVWNEADWARAAELAEDYADLATSQAEPPSGGATAFPSILR